MRPTAILLLIASLRNPDAALANVNSSIPNDCRQCVSYSGTDDYTCFCWAQGPIEPDGACVTGMSSPWPPQSSYCGDNPWAWACGNYQSNDCSETYALNCMHYNASACPTFCEGRCNAPPTCDFCVSQANLGWCWADGDEGMCHQGSAAFPRYEDASKCENLLSYWVFNGSSSCAEVQAAYCATFVAGENCPPACFNSTCQPPKQKTYRSPHSPGIFVIPALFGLGSLLCTCLCARVAVKLTCAQRCTLCQVCGHPSHCGLASSSCCEMKGRSTMCGDGSRTHYNLGSGNCANCGHAQHSAASCQWQTGKTEHRRPYKRSVTRTERVQIGTRKVTKVVGTRVVSEVTGFIDINGSGPKPVVAMNDVPILQVMLPREREHDTLGMCLNLCAQTLCTGLQRTHL